MELPSEIFSNIMLYLDNIKKYSTVSKYFYFNIVDIFNHFNVMFKNIDAKWMYNLDNLVSKLFERNLTDGAIFLLNNYTDCHLHKIVVKYASLYGNKFLINYTLDKVKKYFHLKCHIEEIECTHLMPERYTYCRYISFKHLVIGGHMDLIKEIIKSVPEYFIKNTFYLALLNNHEQLYNFLLETITLTRQHYLQIYKAIASKGNLEVFKKYIDYIYESDLENLEKCIGCSGNVEIIEWYIKTYKNCDYIISGIVKSGNIALFDKYSNNIKNPNSLIRYTIRSGSIELLNKINYDRDIALEYAVIYKKHHIVEKLLNETTNINYTKLAIAASEIGNVDLVKYAIKNGAVNFEEIACCASFNGHLCLVKYMCENYKLDMSNLVSYAAKGGYIEILDYIRTIYDDVDMQIIDENAYRGTQGSFALPMKYCNNASMFSNNYVLFYAVKNVIDNYIFDTDILFFRKKNSKYPIYCYSLE